jgi:hypothetical protein
MTGSFASGFQSVTPGDFPVGVQQSDLLQAQEVLAELESMKKHIDWSSVDVGEPGTLPDPQDACSRAANKSVKKPLF